MTDDKWISVKERMPESGVFGPAKVLVSTTNNNVMMAAYMQGDEGFALITFIDGVTGEGDQYGRVTHWQPLPSPPAATKE